jgi:phosphocarrier protein
MTDPAPLDPPFSARAVLRIFNKRGLHARASAKFVKLAERFDADITVTKDGTQVSACSIMGLMMLAAGPGSDIEVRAMGMGAVQAVSSLRGLVERGFDESD